MSTGIFACAPETLGNDGRAGQYRTPSSPQPQQGRAADNLTMPDAKTKQVRIGDVIWEPAGFFQSGFVVYKDGRRVQPTQCLRTIYDALLAQQDAQGET